MAYNARNNEIRDNITRMTARETTLRLLHQLSSLQCTLRRAQQAAEASLRAPTSPSNWHKIDVHPLIRSYVGSTMKSALKNPAPRSMTVACLTPCVSRAGFVQA